MAKQTKSRIVDDELDLHPFRGQGSGNFVASIGVFKVARNQNWRRAASGDDFARQRRQAIPASVNQALVDGPLMQKRAPVRRLFQPLHR